MPKEELTNANYLAKLASRVIAIILQYRVVGQFQII